MHSKPADQDFDLWLGETVLRKDDQYPATLHTASKRSVTVPSLHHGSLTAEAALHREVLLATPIWILAVWTQDA